MKKPASKKSKGQSPRNNRLFTELAKINKFGYFKIGVFSLVTTFLLVSILLRGYDLLEGEKMLHAASIQRQSLENQKTYWLGVTKLHLGYRDAYFKLAVLSYQLGEKKDAKMYLDTTLNLDPNFKEAREFATQVGL